MSLAVHGSAYGGTVADPGHTASKTDECGWWGCIDTGYVLSAPLYLSDYTARLSVVLQLAPLWGTWLLQIPPEPLDPSR